MTVLSEFVDYFFLNALRSAMRPSRLSLLMSR